MAMRKITTPSERMKEILSALGISANDFENKCGIGHGFVARVTRAITKKNRAKIKMAFPTVNMDYVAAGVGDLFVSETTVPPPTIKERIKIFCDTMTIPEMEFCRKAGIAESFIKNLTGGIRGTSLEKIYKAYPRLNPMWLEYGEGDMLIQEKEIGEKNSNYERIDALIDFLGLTKTQFVSETGTNKYYASSQKDITKSSIDKIVKRYPFVNPMWLLHGRGEMINNSLPTNITLAPLVTKKSSYLKDLSIRKLDKYPIPTIEDAKGKIMAFEIGSDIIVCREANTKQPLPIEHYPFVLVTDKIEYGTIKEIKDDIITFEGKKMRLSECRKVFLAITRITPLLH